jgi:hypothetical protein
MEKYRVLDILPQNLKTSKLCTVKLQLDVENAQTNENPKKIINTKLYIQEYSLSIKNLEFQEFLS